MRRDIDLSEDWLNVLIKTAASRQTLWSRLLQSDPKLTHLLKGKKPTLRKITLVLKHQPRNQLLKKERRNKFLNF
jgi:hypothetical protein